MDYFSKALGSLNIGLPFTLGDEIKLPNRIHVIHDAIWKKDSSEVTTFQYSTKSPVEVDKGNNANQVLRKLKLPGVVRYVDTAETFDTMYVVVERVVPFQFGNLSLDAAKYILQEVIKALQTILEVAGCRYEDTLSEIMESGSTGLPVLTVFDSAHFIDKNTINPAGPKYCPTVNREQLYSLFNTVLESHQDLQREFLKLCGLPVLPQGDFASRSHDFGLRRLLPRLETPISNLLSEIDSSLLMEPLQLTAFCERVESVAPSLWPGVIKGTVLPALIKTKKPEALRTCLKLIIKLQDPLKDDDPVTKFIIQQFENMDRVVRLEMLKIIPQLIDLLSPKVVQTNIMPKLSFGFTDSEVIMRRASVASVEFFAPKLNARQLNTELLRLLAKTHNDADADVRALTTTVLYKLAPQLETKSVISTALGRALKDPVPKCREAALNGVLKIDAPSRELAEKLLGPAASGMLDKDPQVSAEAWRVTDILLSRIQKDATAKGPGSIPTSSATLSSPDSIAVPSVMETLQSAPRIQNENQHANPVRSNLMLSSKFGSTPSSAATKPNLANASISAKSVSEIGGAHDSEIDESAWGWGDEEEDEEQEAAQGAETAADDAEAVESAWGWDD